MMISPNHHRFGFGPIGRYFCFPISCNLWRSWDVFANFFAECWIYCLPKNWRYKMQHLILSSKRGDMSNVFVCSKRDDQNWAVDHLECGDEFSITVPRSRFWPNFHLKPHWAFVTTWWLWQSEDGQMPMRRHCSLVRRTAWKDQTWVVWWDFILKKAMNWWTSAPRFFLWMLGWWHQHCAGKPQFSVGCITHIRKILINIVGDYIIPYYTVFFVPYYTILYRCFCCCFAY